MNLLDIFLIVVVTVAAPCAIARGLGFHGLVITSESCRWEFGITPMQWLIGFNCTNGFANAFFLCFRVGCNPEAHATAMREHIRRATS